MNPSIILKNFVKGYSKKNCTKSDVLLKLRHIIHNTEKYKFTSTRDNVYIETKTDCSKIDLRGHVDRY
jgi:hypothetical protein